MKTIDNNLTSRKKSNKKLLLTAVITAVISVFISFVVFYFVFLGDARFLKLKQLDFLVRNNFYGDVDETELTDSIIEGYVKGIGDRFAGYYDVESTEKRVDSLNGNGSGIGIIVTEHPDTGYIYVKNVYDDGPAAKAGIVSGDQITAIDNISVLDTGYSQAVDSIIRELGETVELALLRGDKSITVTVEYSKFTTQTVFAQFFDGGYGYIEITSFNNETTAQFENAVNQLVQLGAKALIFDLRGNGGGTVDSVTEMVDFICPEGVVMTVKYADGREEVLAESDKNEIDLPMVVLTDGSTASASELFTASVKEFGKGISVGEKTFGKGVMQTTYNLYDGSSVAFTVAEFLPHSGNSFNGVGISPNIEISLTEEQSKYRHQLSKDSDPVISAAVEYLNEQ